MAGMVFLVGAGPGDQGLLTVRGADLLRRADVVVYDRLVNPVLLDLYVRDEAERVYVGKASDHHTMKQEEINALLLAKALEGKVVVRLHGGDPVVFGRGGEEAASLAEAGIPFEVVPGITSAVAAPAYAGIPVTHRGYTSSFSVLTGHERADGAESRVCWEKLATGAGTLVLLMGLANLQTIVDELLQHGRPLDTPVALIRWGSWPQQETITGMLCDIAEKARAVELQPPVVIVVGNVVDLRESLRWWDNRTLSGKRVLVTRTRHQASSLASLLRDQGADPVEVPVLKIVPPESFDEIDRCILRLGGYDWVAFTSGNGVGIFMSRVKALGLDARAFGKARLAAIGPATAEELARHGLRADLVPEEYVAERLAEAMLARGMAGRRVLLPRAGEAREVLSDILEECGAIVDRVVCYNTLPALEGADVLRRELASGRIDAVTLASSSTVEYLMEMLGADAIALLDRAVIACIGPITAATARKLGLRVDVEASEHTIPGLVKALVQHLKMH
ncbi:MAG TPA: uroporphyrinogen-III C-methyltransferase [Chloroflexota bacterium]|nr:uroporphyrinogen-III C-methyltransferase [Chloroflexota bacterium]